MAQVDNHTGIALLEGRYWERANVSYRGVFDMLSEVKSAALNDGRATSNDYHYETANSRPAIEEAICRLAGMPNIRYICIAGHGEADNVSLINGDTIACTEIADMLASSDEQNYHGIHFSTCNTINIRAAKSMLGRLPDRKWVSGYRKQIGFIEASALDMLFFNYIIDTSRSRPIKILQDATKRLMKNCERLVEHLGFGVFSTDAESGEVRDFCQLS